MKEHIEQVKKALAKAGKPFVYNPEEELDDENQTASILFITQKNGKEYLVDGFVMTSRFHYHMEVMDEAEAQLLKKYPKLQGKDYVDFSEEQQDELDSLMDELYEQETIHVQEFIEENIEEDEQFIELEVGLNREELTPQILEQLVKDYIAGNVKLDTTALSFVDEWEDEE